MAKIIQCILQFYKSWSSFHYVISFVCLCYLQATHDLSQSFWCKIRMPWNVHALSKNLLELRKNFSMSISKRVIEDLSHFPASCIYNWQQALLGQTSNMTPMSPGTPWHPRTPVMLWVPKHRRCANTCTGKPQGIWSGNSLQGSSSWAWVGSQTFLCL